MVVSNGNFEMKIVKFAPRIFVAVILVSLLLAVAQMVAG